MATPAERLAELQAKETAAKRARLAQLMAKEQAYTAREKARQEAANAPPPEPGVEDKLLGGADALAALGAGAVMELPAGLLGMATGASGLLEPTKAGEVVARETGIPFLGTLATMRVNRDRALSKAAETVEQTQEYAYSPRTKTGQGLLRKLGKAIDFLSIEKGLDWTGEKIAQGSGSPLLGALTKAGVEFYLPGPLEIKSSGRAVSKGIEERGLREKNIENLVQEAAKTGVDLTAPLETQKKQIVSKAIDYTNGRWAIGSGLPEVQQAVISAQRATKKVADELFDIARSKKAGVPLKTLQAFVPEAEKVLLTSYNLKQMPYVRNALADLKALQAKKTRAPGWTSVDIRDIENVRRRIISSRPPKADASQNAALSVLKGMMDRYMDDLFDSSMLSGDKKAIQAWKNARSAWRDYSVRFNEEAAIKNIVEKKRATPKELKDWIYGLQGAVETNKQAARVVQRLNESLSTVDPVTGKVLADGKDHPAMKALRQEALMDIMGPLLGPEAKTFESSKAAQANLSQFVVNYNKMIRDEEFVKALFDQETLDGLDNLAQYGRAVANKEIDKLPPFDLEDAMSKALFGNVLAQATVRLDAWRRLFRYINKFTESQDTARRRVLGEIYGYKTGEPAYGMGSGDWISIRPVSNQAIVQSILAQSEQEEEQKRQEALKKRPPGVQTRGTLSPGQGQPPAQPPPGAGAPPGGAPNTQSRMMLQSLFPQDTTLQMPIPQPPPMPA